MSETGRRGGKALELKTQVTQNWLSIGYPSAMSGRGWKRAAPSICDTQPSVGHLCARSTEDGGNIGTARPRA